MGLKLCFPSTRPGSEQAYHHRANPRRDIDKKNRSELTGLYKTLITEKWIVTLFPFWAASNWFYTYQNNDFNAPHFTIRTRSFNGLWSNFFNMLVGLPPTPYHETRLTPARVCGSWEFFWISDQRSTAVKFAHAVA